MKFFIESSLRLKNGEPEKLVDFETGLVSYPGYDENYSSWRCVGAPNKVYHDTRTESLPIADYGLSTSWALPATYPVAIQEKWALAGGLVSLKGAIEILKTRGDGKIYRHSVHERYSFVFSSSCTAWTLPELEKRLLELACSYPPV